MLAKFCLQILHFRPESVQVRGHIIEIPVGSNDSAVDDVLTTAPRTNPSVTAEGPPRSLLD